MNKSRHLALWFPCLNKTAALFVHSHTPYTHTKKKIPAFSYLFASLCFCLAACIHGISILFQSRLLALASLANTFVLGGRHSFGENGRFSACMSQNSRWGRGAWSETKPARGLKDRTGWGRRLRRGAEWKEKKGEMAKQWILWKRVSAFCFFALTFYSIVSQ